MDIGPYTLFVLPIFLGLLGFIEPCTVGGHLLFLRSLGDKPPMGRVGAATIFVVVRSCVAGLFGALIASLGQHLISAQTVLWLIFGAIYAVIGVAYLVDLDRLIKIPIGLAPLAWKSSRHPAVLGLVFGLNIPACAAPILFALLAVAASTGSAQAGFAAMALFGFALSLPLLPFALWPRLSSLIDKLSHSGFRTRRWLGTVFVILGLWSIWFGLFVDPVDWSKL